MSVGEPRAWYRYWAWESQSSPYHEQHGSGEDARDLAVQDRPRPDGVRPDWQSAGAPSSNGAQPDWLPAVQAEPASAALAERVIDARWRAQRDDDEGLAEDDDAIRIDARWPGSRPEAVVRTEDVPAVRASGRYGLPGPSEQWSAPNSHGTAGGQAAGPPARTPGDGRFHVEHGTPTPRQAQVLVVANQKGGVGKTTTAVSLAAAIGEEGLRVLLLDLDPQGNATSGIGLRARSDGPTIYEVLVEGQDARTAVVPTEFVNLSAIPANLDLAGAEIELVSAFNRERRLRHSLEPLRPEFDVIIIDCPPSLGLLTVNALSAGDGVVVPIQCEYFALEGLGALRRNTDLIRTQLNPGLQILGFVLTMLDARTRLSQQVVDEVRAHFGDLVFRTRVPRSVRLAEAPGFGQPITVFDPASRGAMAYRNLALEVIDRIVPAGSPARVHEGVRS